MGKFNIGDKITFIKEIKDLYRSDEFNHKNDKHDLSKMIDHLDEPMNVTHIDGYIHVDCEVIGVKDYIFLPNELELFDIGLVEADALTRIDLTIDEINQIIRSAELTHDLESKLEKAKISAIESAKKNKIFKTIRDKFGITIDNPEDINTSGDKIIHVHTDDGMSFVQLSITPNDKKGRFFRFDENLNVTEIFPKIRVVTKTEVDWLDEDSR
jgi:hypothetical protein